MHLFTVEYSDYKSDPDNVVLVKVDTPGLKSKAKLFGRGQRVPSNATISLQTKER